MTTLLFAAASKPFIDWNALWRIVLAALIGGSGVVIAFGILLLAVQRARSPRPRRPPPQSPSRNSSTGW